MIIIDTRSPEEYATSHVKGALNLPPETFMATPVPAALADTPKDTPIVVYCRSGARSNTVKAILSGQGFTNITNGINQGHVEKLLAANR